MQPELSGKKNQIDQYLNLPNDLSSKLHAEAERNKAFNAIIQSFGNRERSRKQVTLRNLTSILTKEGYEFERGDYARCLRFLATLGIGELDTDLKGSLRSLKNINVSLQAIAEAAAVGVDKKQEVKKIPPRPKTHPKKDQGNASISITALDKTLTIDLPIEVATKYLFAIMAEIKNK